MSGKNLRKSAGAISLVIIGASVALLVAQDTPPAAAPGAAAPPAAGRGGRGTPPPTAWAPKPTHPTG